MSAHERRECRSCEGVGFVQVDATYDYATGELVKEMAACSVCRGWGTVPLFLYAPLSTRRKADIRRMEDNEVWRLAWVGNARERKDAEKELRQRGRRNR
jgi:hypothetical protein